jgi:pyruvate/2-oxoglutarate dehydrogenase complex dihydrolipoamide acyltransferase (E2) component
MKMADYVEQIDRLHDEMMRCQHRGDDAGYEHAKQQYLELEKQARQGMVPETAGTTPATMPPSPAAAKQAQAIVQKAADNRAISLANIAGVVPNNVAEGSADWPFDSVNEVSDATLTSYKEKARQSAEQLSAAGKHRAATDRYGNIMKATGRQIDRTTKNIARALGKK